MNKKNAIFISAGINEDLATYVLKNNIDNFDVYINIYENFLNQTFVESKATKCFYYPTTKFIALKKIYNDFLKDYNTVAVFDDDGVFTHGSIEDLVEYINIYDLDIIAPSQHPYGKLSNVINEVTRYYKGDHKFRLTNFIEMNFPLFKNTALKKYMDIYDGELCGFGNDWWYLNVLDADNRDCCGITDKVVIYNPNHNQKKYSYPLKNTDIDKYMSLSDRQNQWDITKEKYKLNEWHIKNKRFVY